MKQALHRWSAFFSLDVFRFNTPRHLEYASPVSFGGRRTLDAARGLSLRIRRCTRRRSYRLPLERKSTMAMKNPPHPGEVVLHECIEPLGLTITAAAAALGVTR